MKGLIGLCFKYPQRYAFCKILSGYIKKGCLTMLTTPIKFWRSHFEVDVKLKRSIR